MVTRLLATKLYPEFIKIPVSRRRHRSGSDDASHLRKADAIVEKDWCYPFAVISFMTLLASQWVRDPAQREVEGLLILNVGLGHAPQTIVALAVCCMTCAKLQEPEPEAWKGRDEGGVL
ncbi:hypothetical protein OIU78_001034 [Salix suchowensis]|nr:hypothetical protein OIU78_001034 [Salix suchowensis]